MKKDSVLHSIVGTFFHCLLFIGCLFLTGCHPKSCDLEPEIIYFPQSRFISSLPPCFPPLTDEEMKMDWAKEAKIANTFAKELDLYRAITSYKRALILIPARETLRKQEIAYDVMFAYYLGCKYQDAIATFEDHGLERIPDTFPAFRNIMIILYDSYQKIGELDKACAILKLIENYDADLARDLRLSEAMRDVDLEEVELLIENHPKRESLDSWLACYCLEAKSVQKAQTLNALFPGAGYYYVGQKKSALTSFLLNAVFIAATYQFIEHGYPAAAIITGSLEMGWYLGGINGAGLEVKAYNEAIYGKYTKEAMMQNRLFPVLMFQCAF